MIDPSLVERMCAQNFGHRWAVLVERPPDAGMRDFCPLWHGVHSANDEPDGRRAGDDWGIPERFGALTLVDGWRVVSPAEAGRSRALWRGEPPPNA